MLTSLKTPRCRALFVLRLRPETVRFRTSCSNIGDSGSSNRAKDNKDRASGKDADIKAKKIAGGTPLVGGQTAASKPPRQAVYESPFRDSKGFKISRGVSKSSFGDDPKDNIGQDFPATDDGNESNGRNGKEDLSSKSHFGPFYQRHENYEVTKRFKISSESSAERASKLLSIDEINDVQGTLPDITTKMIFPRSKDWTGLDSNVSSSASGQHKAESNVGQESTGSPSQQAHPALDISPLSVYSGLKKGRPVKTPFLGVERPLFKEYEVDIHATHADELVSAFPDSSIFSLNRRTDASSFLDDEMKLPESFKQESSLFVQASLWNKPVRSELEKFSSKLDRASDKNRRSHLILEAPSRALWRDLNDWVYKLVSDYKVAPRVIHLDAFLLAKIARLHFNSNTSQIISIADELDKLCFRSQNYRSPSHSSEENDDIESRDFNEEEESVPSFSNGKPWVQPIEILNHFLGGISQDAKIIKTISMGPNGAMFQAENPAISSYEYRPDHAVILAEGIRAILTAILDYPYDCIQFYNHQSIPERQIKEQRVPLIVHIPFIERFLEGNGMGKITMNVLQDLLAERRHRGEKNLIIGTIPSDTSEYKYMDDDEGFRVISANIGAAESKPESAFREADRRIVLAVENYKNFERFLLKKIGNEASDNILDPVFQSTAIQNLPELNSRRWDHDYVDRVTTAMAGRWSQKGTLNSDDLKDVLEIVDRNIEFESAEKSTDGNSSESSGLKFTASSLDCNNYEERLLSRILDPKNIKVTYDSVRLPENTIKTLQTLVSLPLKHPDAFNYGVLAENSVSGVLVFGPPGTGKTMLAKAVAKESGANMLEIKPSDLLHKYVGESEKLVRAVFSLARKLAPCVVFFDEIDSLLNHRSSGDTSYRRDLINEFMMNWDGMSSENKGVIIMGSTNRPFDLDEAVIRRLPYRILVDLPDESDRNAILKTHLTGEKLGSSVSIEQLAKETELYSGSDLKNVCVNAALMSAQASHDYLIKSGASPDTKLEIRTLKHEHFEKALKQIGPSISSEMGSLRELRKWDEKYGSQRKRVSRSMGFGGA